MTVEFIPLSATPEVLQNPYVEAFEIDLAGTPDPDTSGTVLDVIWSEDSNSIYYAFAPSIGERPLKWASYTLADATIAPISSPLNFDNSIWERLHVPDPAAEVAIYPELLGYMSPSGSHVIYTVAKDGSTSPSGSIGTEIWVANADGTHKTKVLDIFPGIIHQAAWTPDESQVVFEHGYEGPGRVFVANVQSGTTVPLGAITDIDGTTEDVWALSPDGRILAIINNGLRLVNLQKGPSKAVAEHARWPFWSKDGNLLYYWWGPSFEEIGAEIRVYDLRTGETSIIIDEASLAEAFRDFYVSPLLLAPDFYAGAPFAVSPRGDTLALWGGWLWLVNLAP